MTQTLENVVSLMCNLSMGVEERGIQKGIDKGNIYGAIAVYKDVERSENVIVKKLQEKFQLTEEAAKIYLEEAKGVFQAEHHSVLPVVIKPSQKLLSVSFDTSGL